MENLSPYRTWAPAESSVRIEYATSVLGQLRRESANGDAGGTLFGVRRGDDLRVLAARVQADAAKADPTGLDPVGIFVARVRGEVFLTESDLERLFNTGGCVALVVAGAKGGFFVREADGSIQTIRSYQEFPLVGVGHHGSRGRAWMILSSVALVMLFLLARADWRRLPSRPPEELTIQRDADQLRIAWNPAAVGKNDRLYILEGIQETAIPIPATGASATYVPRTSDTDVRVFRVDEYGQPGHETALFLGNEPAPSPELDRTRREIGKLEAAAAALRSGIQANRRRIGELQNLVDRVTAFR